MRFKSDFARAQPGNYDSRELNDSFGARLTFVPWSGSSLNPGWTLSKASERRTEYTRDRVEKNLNAYLYYGVTTVRSVGTERDAGFEVLKAQRNGALLGARLFTAGIFAVR